MTTAPLAIDLYCGSFAWSAGWLARGGHAVGFDLEHQEWHGAVPDGARLVIQDVRTLHGSQLKDARLILASPPCQEFSWRAMPWTRAKAAPPPVLGIEFHPRCRIGSPRSIGLRSRLSAPRARPGPPQPSSAATLPTDATRRHIQESQREPHTGR